MSKLEEMKKLLEDKLKKLPILATDFLGKPISIGHHVIYSCPNNARGAGTMLLGEVIGKSQGYIKIQAISESHYGIVHHKHGYNLYRLGGDEAEMIMSIEEVEGRH